MDKENLKKDIISAIKNIKKSKSVADIVRMTKGIPMGLLMPELGNPKLKDTRDAVYELWKNGDIDIYGWHYKSQKKEIIKFLDKFINDDDWFIYAHIDEKSQSA